MIKIGMIIGDRYEILEKIGTGGMSDVYKAKCHKLNRFVAMKVLKQEFSENANFVSKFRIEAQAAAGLSHPNIVNVYDVGEENGIYYIVMELVEGITLKKYIEKKARLSVKEAVSIAIQVCMGIEAAHNNHIIHRDIKPQNIIISKEGKVKVTDFGIAKAATSNTITSNVMGSVHYTSPEQARGGFSDAKSDVYSLGITLFEMLTGRVAFNGETTVAIAIKHIQEEMPSPREFVSEIPVSVEQIVFKCCQKSPDRRYQSMGALINDLKKSLMNPDEDFVKPEDMAGEGSTRVIPEKEVAQIKTARQGDAAQEIPFMQESRSVGGSRGQREFWSAQEGYVRERRMTAAHLERDYGREEEYGEYEGDYEGDYGGYEEYGEGYEKEPDPRMEKVTTALAIIAAVLIGCVVIVLVGRAFGLFQFAWLGDKVQEEEQVAEAAQVEMVQVTGMKLDEAKVTLIGMGLTPEIRYEESTEYESGIVMKSSVPQGNMAEVGSNVILTVSTGSEGIETPELIGKTEAEATALLEQKGFLVIRSEGYDDYIQTGSVFYQDPAAGSKVPKGTSVTIRVSLGKEDKKIQMPELLGQTEADAVIILTEAGLVPGEISYVNHEDPAMNGLVCHQSYSVNASVEKGTKVDLQVSTGPSGPLYRYSAVIQGPTAAEDANFKAGTTVTVTLVAADGKQLWSTQTASFPTPEMSVSNINSASGVLLFQYVNVTDARTVNNDDGTTKTIEGTTENKELRREVVFTAQ